MGGFKLDQERCHGEPLVMLHQGSSRTTKFYHNPYNQKSMAHLSVP